MDPAFSCSPFLKFGRKTMADAQLKLVTPTLDVEPTIAGERTTPTRLPNAAYRSREYLTPTEMDAIIEAARKMRHGHRDATMLLACYKISQETEGHSNGRAWCY
jgi:hypothetical protein